MDRTITIMFQARIDGKKLKSRNVLNTASATFLNAEGVEGIRKASCQICVKHKIMTESVNGSITDPIDQIPIHTNKTVSYQAKKGYYLESISVDGEKISTTDYPDQYTFQDICGNHKIRVIYKKIPVLGINKTSDKTVYRVNNRISFAIKVSQKAKGASTENVVVTDEGMTPGLKIEWDTIFVYGAGKNDYKITRTEQGGFRLVIKKIPNAPGDILITYYAVVEDPALAGSAIHNTARVTCDHSGKEEFAVWQGTVKGQLPAGGESIATGGESITREKKIETVQTAAPLITARPKTTPVPAKGPETGDRSPIKGVMVLFFVSVCAAMGVGFWRNKKKTKKDVS